MQYRIVLSILISFSQVWAQRAATDTTSTASPNGQNVAIYKSNPNGTGTIHFYSNGKQKLVFKTLDHRIPTIDWLANDLASINISCGSPCWYRRYYDVSKGKLSREYEFAQDALPSRKLVAHIGPDSILVSEIFSGKIVASYKPTISECSGLLCYAELKFADSSKLIVNFGKSSKTIFIPN